MTEADLDIARLRLGSVLVVGDVMLDNFVYGEVSRISSEAPIPILSLQDEKSMAGGAANVALNVAALGATVAVIGMVGADEAGLRLRELIAAGCHPVAADLVVDEGRPTTVKTRYVGNKQQILRTDRENTAPAAKSAEDELIARATARLPAAKVVAISDYAKGVLTDRVIKEVIRLCRETGVPLVVDPKRARWDIYRGATIIKPNLQELERATGLDCSREEEANRAAAQIIAALGVCVLLTRSHRGMSLYRAGRVPVHARAAAHEVFDVSGAGDTALSAFCASIAAGFSQDEAMHIANVASGVAVTKLGTAVVAADELGRAWADGFLLSTPERGVSRRHRSRQSRLEIERSVAL